MSNWKVRSFIQGSPSSTPAIYCHLKEVKILKSLSISKLAKKLLFYDEGVKISKSGFAKNSHFCVKGDF